MTNPHHGLHGLGGDLAAVRVAEQLVEFTGQLGKVVAHVAHEECGRVRRDAPVQRLLQVVRNPLHHAVFTQRLAFARRGARRPALWHLLVRRQHQHQHDVARRVGEVLIQHGQRRLLQRLRLAQHDHAALGHHRQLFQQPAQADRIEFRAAADVHVEVPHRHVDGAREQQPKDLFLDEVLVAKKHVHRVEGPGVKGGAEGSRRGDRHRGELYPHAASPAELLIDVVHGLQAYRWTLLNERSGPCGALPRERLKPGAQTGSRRRGHG